jgi:hypothetical protein
MGARYKGRRSARERRRAVSARGGTFACSFTNILAGLANFTNSDTGTLGRYADDCDGSPRSWWRDRDWPSDANSESSGCNAAENFRQRAFYFGPDATEGRNSADQPHGNSENGAVADDVRLVDGQHHQADD